MVLLELERLCLPRPLLIKLMQLSLEWLVQSLYKSIWVKDLEWLEMCSDLPKKMHLPSFSSMKSTLLQQRDLMLTQEQIEKFRES